MNACCYFAAAAALTDSRAVARFARLFGCFFTRQLGISDRPRAAVYFRFIRVGLKCTSSLPEVRPVLLRLVLNLTR